MKKHVWKSVVSVGVAAMTICMGTMTVTAADTPTIGTGGSDGSDASAHVTKFLEMAEGITVPTGSFTFTAKSITADAPQAEIAPIGYSSSDEKGDLSNGIYQLEKTGNITFGTFPHAGEYVYTVIENENAYNLNTGEVMVYSTETYTMRVRVMNGENGLYISDITAENSSGVKVDDMSFTNVLKNENTSLSIKKNTRGDMADKTKDFGFTITFLKSATADSDTFTGKIGSETVICEAGEEKSFELHNGESLVFENLPAGTRYVVTEEGTANYTPEVTVVENGTQTVKESAKKGESLATAKAGNTNLVGENENVVVYTNTFDNVPVTGVIVNLLPYILMLVGAAAIIAVTFLAKRK